MARIGTLNVIRLLLVLLTALLGGSVAVQVDVSIVPVPISPEQQDVMAQIVVPVLALLWGVGLSIIGVAQGNTVGEAIRNKIIGADYVLDRYNTLVSFHAITAVMTVNVLGILKEATLNGVSTRAVQFYGMAPDYTEERLLHKTGQELAQLLEEFIEPKHYTLFLEDQERVLKQYVDGFPAIARMPVIFNDKHPYYANKAFLPVIVSLGEPKKRKDGSSHRLIQIAYLEVADFIPAVDMYREIHGSGERAD